MAVVLLNCLCNFVHWVKNLQEGLRFLNIKPTGVLKGGTSWGHFEKESHNVKKMQTNKRVEYSPSREIAPAAVAMK